LQHFIGRPSEILLACEGDQRERYLLPCARGERHECFALTEPGAGSDIMSMATRAKRDGDDYLINGSKHFISSHTRHRLRRHGRRRDPEGAAQAGHRLPGRQRHLGL
jgi:alkylation response protein AidB-like acyl-CoA dehydrogenase